MIALQPNSENYSQLLEDKIAAVTQQFSQFSLPNIDIYPSQALHFRHRANFTLWHIDDEVQYAVFPNGRDAGPTFVSEFHIASKQINKLMKNLLPLIQENNTLKHKAFQANFHSTLSGQSLITLTYHKQLDDAWQEAAASVAQNLSTNIVGRSRKQKVIIGNDYVVETLDVGGRTLQYQQLEGCFTQSNALICQDMLSWADSILHNIGDGDLLELYCGNGNFTLAMAPHFNQVLATELVKQLTSTAAFNCQQNLIKNVDVVRMSAEDVVKALNKERAFRRLKDIDLDNYNFKTLFVDPPRSGLDSTCLDLAERFEHVLYISCNPDTLHRDLKQLCGTFNIDRFAVFDQFPYTHHLECGVILSKR